jgi:hypothetical protein
MAIGPILLVGILSGRRSAVWLLGALSVLGSIEPSAWYRLVGGTEVRGELFLLISEASTPQARHALTGFVVLDIMLLTVYGLLLLQAYRVYLGHADDGQ